MPRPPIDSGEFESVIEEDYKKPESRVQAMLEKAGISLWGRQRIRVKWYESDEESGTFEGELSNLDKHYLTIQRDGQTGSGTIIGVEKVQQVEKVE